MNKHSYEIKKIVHISQITNFHRNHSINLAALYLSSGPYYGRIRSTVDKTDKGSEVVFPGDCRID